MEVVKEAVCFRCKHLHSYPRCAAYPQGIPQEVRNGENDHKEHIPGDRGIKFEVAGEE